MAAPKTKTRSIDERLMKTTLNHIFNFDISGDGRMREVAVVKADRNPDKSIRSIYYIDVALLDNVDKGRLKTIVTSRHSDKYELWDLLAQSTLSNGKNALDYFHQLVRSEQGVGTVNTSLGGGLAGVKSEGAQIIGSEFSDPTSAALETQAAS
jgi:hypothetical protein